MYSTSDITRVDVCEPCSTHWKITGTYKILILIKNVKERDYIGGAWVILNWDFPRCDVDWIHLKNAVFWDVAPCRYCVNRRFGGTVCCTCLRWFARGFLLVF
jgi:hypothetical protein